MNILFAVLVFCAVGFAGFYVWYDVIQKYDLLNRFSEWFKRQRTEVKTIIVCSGIAVFFTFLYEKPLTFKGICFSFIECVSTLCSFISVWGLLSIISALSTYTFSFKKIVPFLIAGIIAFPSAWQYFGGGIERPGALFEKSEYEGTFIVTMSRKPEAEHSRTVYYLPAHISKFEDEIGEQTSYIWYNGEREDIPNLGVFYHIDSLFFSNGGYLTFEEENIIFLGEEVEIYDYTGDRYYITLTSEKTEKK